MKYKLTQFLFNFKEFTKNYLIPPKIWFFISSFYNLNISKKDKSKNQYPYSWNGQNFTPKEYSQNFEKELQKTKVCVTRRNETKFSILLKEKHLIKLKIIDNFYYINFSISPININQKVRDVSIKADGKKIAFRKGNLNPNEWVHVKLFSDTFLTNNLEIDWLGGQIYLSEISYTEDHKKTKNTLSSNSTKKNIIVLVLDSMLPENIKLMNPNMLSESITPYIDSFFQNGFCYNNAFTISEYTMPSLATMMTGLYPIEHGVFTHDKNQRSIPTNIPTLAETLKKNGFKTFGYSTGQRFSPLYGHYRGFDRFLSHNPYRSDKTFDDQVNMFTEFLEANRNSSCFGFLHILDSHPPFASNTYFSDMSANEFRWSDKKDLYAEFKMHRDSTNLISELRKVEKVAVTNLDFILSKLFSYLEFNNMQENTTVFLLSDHGRTYNKSKPLLQNNLTKIPFLISGQNKHLIQRNNFIQPSLDLYPSIMKICAIDEPSHLSGKDAITDKNAIQNSYVISESLFRRDGEIAINNKKWLYALNCEFDYNKGFFDLNAKKGEWLFKKDLKNDIEDTTTNFIDKGYSIQGEFLDIVKNHYISRKRFFSPEDVIVETKDYPE